MKNEIMDHKILAKYFQGKRSLASANEAMRQLKRKYEKDKTGLWSVYVRAYNWDQIVKEI